MSSALPEGKPGILGIHFLPTQDLQGYRRPQRAPSEFEELCFIVGESNDLTPNNDPKEEMADNNSKLSMLQLLHR